MHLKQSLCPVVQNLEDAGCDAATVEQFLSLMKKRQTAEQLALLSRHRRQLLDDLHRDERRIDCLDYLVYQIQKATQQVKEETDDGSKRD